MVVTGRVQGVCFRYWTRQKALALGLSGWVRNRQDGSVEAEFCGADRPVNEMLRLCRKGPDAALVQQARINILLEPAENTGFSILATR